MRLCEWTQFSSYTVSHTPRSRQCCHDMFHTRWQRRRRTGNQAINWTSRMAYNLTNLFYNAPLQTSKMSISDQRKMLRCMVDRLIRCHTLSMHSNRHGKKQWQQKVCLSKNMQCTTVLMRNFLTCKVCNTQTWCEWHWDMARALLKGDARIACLSASQLSLYDVSHNPRSWQWYSDLFHTRMSERTYV